jgi:hypothetical protein
MGSGDTRRQLKRSGRQAFRPDRHTYQDYIRTGQPHIVISTSRADRSCRRKARHSADYTLSVLQSKPEWSPKRIQAEIQTPTNQCFPSSVFPMLAPSCGAPSEPAPIGITAVLPAHCPFRRSAGGGTGEFVLLEASVTFYKVAQ